MQGEATTESRNRAKAVNVAEWVDLSVRALGGTSHFDGSVWWRGPEAPSIYPSAVILGAPESPGAVPAALARALAGWDDSGFSVWDVGGRCDLGGIGLRHAWTRPWLARPPSPAARARRGAVELEGVADLRGLQEYERASKIGFETEDDTARWHASSTLNDARVLYVLGRVGDSVVTSGATYASEGMVGIYAVSTPPPLRRRGYARALVEHLVETHAGSLLGVWPDPISVPIYAELGFFAAGEIAAWVRS